ncbi:hypothetical protein BDR22DRAFT_857668 [Usnea florida]
MRICTAGDLCPFYGTTFVYGLKQGRVSILPYSAHVRPYSVATGILDRADAERCCVPSVCLGQLQFCTPNLPYRFLNGLHNRTPSYHSCISLGYSFARQHFEVYR